MTERIRIDAFDYLRAFAIIPVMLHHFYSPYAVGGGNGVSVFFCLSGFFITRSLFAYNKSSACISTLIFIIKRFFRIYPAYILMVGLNLILFHYFQPEKYNIVKSALISLIFMTSISSWVGYGIGVFWTLHVEAWFYLLIPLIYLFLDSHGLYLLFCLASIVLSVFVIFSNNFSWLPSLLNFPASQSLILYSGNLLVGAVTAVFVPSYFMIKPAWLRYILIAVSLSMIVCIYSFANVSTMDKYLFHLAGLSAAFLTSVIIASVSSQQHDMVQLPGLAFIGRISYSLYLIHGVFLDFFGNIFPRITGHLIGNLASFLIFFVICTSCATITYYFIEKPSMHYGRKFSLYVKNRNELYE